jgi:uncharacterized protein YdhG (YjbR/CyaY superfamily)
MADSSGDRTQYFPAIERKHGGPISLWIERLAESGTTKYPDQIAWLRENHGFSQAHANALVMYVRNSTTSRRFRTPDEYFAAIDPTVAATATAIFNTITKANPDLELVVAWNHPMLRTDTAYVVGLSVAKRHILVNFFSGEVLTAFGPQLTNYKVNKKTFQVPLDWTVDTALLRSMTTARLTEVA